MKKILNVILLVRNAARLQLNATSNVSSPYIALGAPSQFPMENGHETAVVSREPSMKRKILSHGYQ